LDSRYRFARTGWLRAGLITDPDTWREHKAQFEAGARAAGKEPGERRLSEVIAERRATPSFDASRIPDDALSAILRAGMASPSGYNLQPWRFIVIRSGEEKRRLGAAAMNQ
jgi:Nitroreductase family